MNRWACLGLVSVTTLFASSAFADDTGATTTVPTGDTQNANANANAASTNTNSVSATTSTDEKITDVLENKGQTYYFVGANYRMNIVPAFIINLFVDQGPSTVLTSTVGLSFDIRKDHFSIIPGVNFSEYGMDPQLFLQKGKDASDPGNWGVVHSSLKAIYATVDLLWSVPIAKTGQVDFEFGFSVGLGGVFDNLYITWVSNQNAPGQTGPAFQSQSAGTFYQCQTTGPNGCNASNHSGATVGQEKVGAGAGHTEPNWFASGGGTIPTVFPWLELPILGFRFKPIKELEMRLNGGFSITGFFFNFAAYYGFESPKSTPK
jgi:hypothetical protein